MVPQEKQPAMVVCNLGEEYLYVASQDCSCGGPLEVKGQRLARRDEQVYDILTARCLACGREQEFSFEVASFLGKPEAYGEEMRKAMRKATLLLEEKRLAWQKKARAKIKAE